MQLIVFFIVSFYSVPRVRVVSDNVNVVRMTCQGYNLARVYQVLVCMK